MYEMEYLCLDLGFEDFFQGHGVSGKLGDTLTELLDRHLILIEEETE
jgi:hypothetical protein